MTQHRQGALDRRIAVSDYVVDCRIQQEIKELRPLIYALHKDMEEKKKNNFMCDGCGEPGYKCCCEAHIQPHQS